MSDAQILTTDIDGHVYLMGLNRPQKRNAFNLELLRALAEAYTVYEEDDSLRSAVLFAHGNDFTAGLDLAEVGPAVAGGAALFPEDAVDPLDLFGGRRRSKPVVIAVQGWCLTIGIELMLASDVRIAADSTRFGQIEVKRGIMPFGGATLRMPQLTGWGNAMQLLLTGDEFDAAAAYRIGLVQEVTTEGAQKQAAIEVATRIGKQAPLAVQASLLSARTAMEAGRSAELEHLMARAMKLMESEDAAEGLQSFIERREAVFRGR